MTIAVLRHGHMSSPARGACTLSWRGRRFLQRHSRSFVGCDTIVSSPSRQCILSASLLSRLTGVPWTTSDLLREPSRQVYPGPRRGLPPAACYRRPRALFQRGYARKKHELELILGAGLQSSGQVGWITHGICLAILRTLIIRVRQTATWASRHAGGGVIRRVDHGR